jgi:hypothetical protein
MTRHYELAATLGVATRHWITIVSCGFTGEYAGDKTLGKALPES